MSKLLSTVKVASYLETSPGCGLLKEESQALPENFRLILLLPIMGKIYKKKNSGDSTYLAASRSGFRAKRSASDLLPRH